MLEALPPAKFSKPPHLGSLAKAYAMLERYCLDRVKNTPAGSMPLQWNDWKLKIHEGYDRMVETLWGVADELDVRGGLHYLAS
jgi:RNA polymerase II-associated protein 3